MKRSYIRNQHSPSTINNNHSKLDSQVDQIKNRPIGWLVERNQDVKITSTGHTFLQLARKQPTTTISTIALDPFPNRIRIDLLSFC